MRPPRVDPAPSAGAAIASSVAYRGGASAGAVAVLVDQLADLAGLHSSIDVVVHGEDGGEAAGADAAHDFQAEVAVLGGAGDLDFEVTLDLVEHLASAAHVASGAEADADG